MNILLITPQEGQSPYSSLIFLVLIVVVFYFFMIRPQMKRQKETRKFRESLKAGDKVVTTGGIYGIIISVEETSVLLEIDKEVKIRVDKGAIVTSPGNQQQQNK
jgi:preprotein translocase subunit YajC